MIMYSTASAGTPARSKRRLDGDPAQLRAGEVLQRAEKPTNGGTGGTQDHGTGHKGLLRVIDVDAAGLLQRISDDPTIPLPRPLWSMAIDVTLTPTDVMAYPPARCSRHCSPSFTAVDHVGIAVADLDAAIAFHTEHFGLEVTHDRSERGAGRAGGHAARTGDAEGTAIQLLAPAERESTIAKFLDRNGPGLQQLAYRVTDVEAAAEALRTRACGCCIHRPVRGTAGSKVNFVHPKDAGGVLVELVQPGDEH